LTFGKKVIQRVVDNTKPKVCRWCEKSTDLIQAHIIPRHFYDCLAKDGGKVVILKPDRSKYTEISQSGIFDTGMLCAVCDASLGKLDEYGYTVFKNAPTDEEQLVFNHEGIAVGYNLRCDDVQRAYKFLLSVLWRASVSTNDFFDKVSLGEKYERRIREIINNDERVMDTDFEFIINRIFDHPYDGGLVPPWGARWSDGIFAYVLYLPYFKILIRADKRLFTEPFTSCRFLEGVQPQALRLPYAGTSEARYLSKVAAAFRDREAGKVPSRTQFRDPLNPGI
jgi:hypothetical protein